MTFWLAKDRSRAGGAGGAGGEQAAQEVSRRCRRGGELGGEQEVQEKSRRCRRRAGSSAGGTRAGRGGQEAREKS